MMVLSIFSSAHLSFSYPLGRNSYSDHLLIGIVWVAFVSDGSCGGSLVHSVQTLKGGGNIKWWELVGGLSEYLILFSRECFLNISGSPTVVMRTWCLLQISHASLPACMSIAHMGLVFFTLFCIVVMQLGDPH